MFKHLRINKGLMGLLFVLVFSVNSLAQNSDWLKLDTVKAGKFDMGRMWTFDFPPTDYFAETYKFKPDTEWFEKVRMSALRFATYCSASFVSGDGLVMTNHHCGRESITKVTKEGENLHDNGFVAATLADERKVDGLFVDQLVSIQDVTVEVQKAFDSGKTDEEKVKLRKEKMKELETKLQKEKGLKGQVITFFAGGKYSLYGFKTYNDVRLVFAPETQLGFFGGDPDNFTYPRYNLDCTFFRVYDDAGKPLKTENFYKWSPNGAGVGEPVFVVGNPGTTNRLFTVAQLEYQRDFQHPVTLMLLDGLVNIYTEIIAEHPERKDELQDQLFSFANSQKAYGGILAGLRDPILMAKKADFERTIRAKIAADPKLNKYYGSAWTEIEKIRKEMGQYSKKAAAYSIRPMMFADYFTMANEVVKAAKQMVLADSLRDFAFKGLTDADFAKKEFYSAEFDEVLNAKKLAFNLKFIGTLLGEKDPVFVNLSGGKTCKEGAKSLIEKSIFKNKETLAAALKKGPKAVLESGDPFVQYVLATADEGKALTKKMTDLSNKEADFRQKLGRAVFEVYGTSIPPDATFSLRIADGVVDGVEYNGTKAAPITTFYGMYERYFSANKQFPWNLPKRWETPPAGFDLSTPFNFISTADIIGGNSGSPIINKNREIVGLAFDGNIESLPGQFIFDTKANRTVGVHSTGMVEAIKSVYGLPRIAKELRAGKIVD